MKSENPLQDKMRCVARKLLLAMLVVIAIISLWTPLAHSAIAERWFSLPNLWFLMPVPLPVALISLWLWRSLGQQNSHTLPFVLTLGLIFSGSAGWGSVSGPTSFHRPLRCGRRQLRRRVMALCWLARC